VAFPDTLHSAIGNTGDFPVEPACLTRANCNGAIILILRNSLYSEAKGIYS
jgi:hypothetical protein